MRYIGSKTSIVERLYSIVSERVPSGSFCDPFGGIGVIGAYFKRNGYTVQTGDLLQFAHYFQVVRVQIDMLPPFKKLCTEGNLRYTDGILATLNTACAKDGWFVREYSEKRPFFTRTNARRIEACRLLINRWALNGWLAYDEKAVLLASLINSMDKVANTAATYYASLKHYYRKANRPFQFEFLKFTEGKRGCRSFHCDANGLVARRPYDVLYLDPPFNSRPYGRYYHLPETIARGNAPRVIGKSGMPRAISGASAFNRARDTGSALAELLRSARFRLLVFHYSDDGLIDTDTIMRILAQYGSVEKILVNARGYSTTRHQRLASQSLYLVQNA